MDYKKLNTLLYRFSSHYKLGNPNVVNSIVMNIDYLIVNFPYFSNLSVVLDYFLSPNKEFSLALKDRFDLLFRNLQYHKDGKNYKISIRKKVEPATPRKNKLIYDSLDMASQNKVMLWKGVLGGLTLKKLYSSWIRTGGELEEFHAFHLNKDEDVYAGIFKILVFHYESFQKKILPNLEQSDLKNILKYIENESVQQLIRLILSKKNDILYATLSVFEGVRACEYLLVNKRYYELLHYLETVVQTRGLSDSQSSDEEENVWDELYAYRDTLLDLFMHLQSYFEFMPIFQILQILYKVKVDGEIKIVQIEDNLKKRFYIRLLCLALESSLEQIYSSNLHLSFISLFFENPNDSFYAHNLFKFFKRSLCNDFYAHKLKEYGFFENLKKVILRNIAEFYEGRPKTEGIFPYCVYLCLEIKDLGEDGDFVTVYNLSKRVSSGDSLRYSDVEGIDLYLEDCINEVLVRYVSNLVIDRMPVLSAFLSRDEHPLSEVDNPETVEEKRSRLGGGMQDTL